MSLPFASQQQIKAMQEAAEKKFGNIEEDPIQQVQPIVTEEAPIEEPVDDVVEEQDIQEEVQEQQEQPVKKQTAQESWKVIREAKERAEQERDELLRQMIELQKQQIKQNPQQQAAQPEEDDLAEFGIDDDSLTEGKHLKKLIREIKTLKQEVSHYKKSATETALEIKIKQQYPDFEKVATPQNLAALRQADPDLADAIIATQDPLKQAALAYKMVKQYGIYKEDTFVEDKSRALKNAAKPRTVTSLSPQQGDSPLSKANAFASGLTPSLKDQLYKEMIESMKGN